MSGAAGRGLVTPLRRVTKGWTRGCGCSYFVLMESEEKKGDRWLRLGDLAAHEVIVVHCPCGRSVEYHSGGIDCRLIRLSSIYSFGCGARIAIAGVVFASPSLMIGRAGIVRSRGLSGWLWRGSKT